MLHTDEQPEQTRRVVRALAAAYQQATDKAGTERIIQRHHALQRMLEGLPVAIPFAGRLGELFTSDRVEARRGFAQVLSMIQAVALLYQRQRQKDADGQLLAGPDDYHLARRLLAKPLARLLRNRVSDPARRFADRLAGWVTREFTSSEAKGRETNCKSAVYGWLGELHEAGILEMVEPSRGPTPARWKLTGSVPADEGGSGFPTLEEVFPEVDWTHGHNTELVVCT
jgi:hypothetical protein